MDFLARLTEPDTRFYILLAGFGLVASWEGLRPLRRASVSTPLRWFNNFLWIVLNSLFLRLALPAVALGWSAFAANRGWGMLAGLQLGPWGELGVGMLALDLTGYLAHVMLHKFPWLWRLHAVHHGDVDFDCTTGFRFHPLEGLFTSGVRLVVVAGLGVAPLAVALYETWLGLQNLYGHANARFPARLESVLRWLLVTPDMHRVHHSARVEEGLRNYGIVLPWWDRLFRTYRADPLLGHEGMQIGLDWRRRESVWSLPRLIALPFLAHFPPARTEKD